MARASDDPASRARAILAAVPFSRAINGYVLTADQWNELLAILDGDDETAEDAAGPPSKRPKKR